MSGTSNAPASSFSFLPDLATYKEIATFCKALGVKFYTRGNISYLMGTGKFPTPMCQHEKPFVWRRNDVLTWLKEERGIDISHLADMQK